jgi:transposase-like protein
MGKAYSEDLRKRVVAAVVTGRLSCNGAAEQFGVAVSTAIGWVRRQRETGARQDGRPQAKGDFGRTLCLGVRQNQARFQLARAGRRARRTGAEGR